MTSKRMTLGRCRDSVPQEPEVLPRQVPVLCQRLPQVCDDLLNTVLISMPTCHRINVKLGGINTIPDPQSVAILTDPRNPTIVMGKHRSCTALSSD